MEADRHSQPSTLTRRLFAMRVCPPSPGPDEHDYRRVWPIVEFEGIRGGRGMAWDAQELGTEPLEEGAGTPEQALTHATRHVRQETRVLPLDPAYCLVVFRIRDCSSLCFPLHGFPDRCESIPPLLAEHQRRMTGVLGASQQWMLVGSFIMLTQSITTRASTTCVASCAATPSPSSRHVIVGRAAR